MKKWKKQLGGDNAMVALYEPNMEHPLGLRMPAKLSELLTEEDEDPFETLRTLVAWKEEKLLRAHVQRRPTPIFTERGDPLALIEEKERNISEETNEGGMSAASMFYGALVITAIKNGMDLRGLSSGFKFIITGIVLLLAVLIDSISKRRRAVRGLA